MILAVRSSVTLHIEEIVMFILRKYWTSLFWKLYESNVCSDLIKVDDKAES